MTNRVERIAPYVQGEALVLSQGPYTFSLQRVARGASGELWWLYDETKREANNWAGTISIHDDEGGVLEVGVDGVENPIIRSARITATFPSRWTKKPSRGTWRDSCYSSAYREKFRSTMERDTLASCSGEASGIMNNKP